MDINKQVLSSLKNREIFLLDNSFLARIEELGILETFLNYIKEANDKSYLVSIRVLNEKYKFSGDKILNLFKNNLLQSEYAGVEGRGVKENRFIVEENGELKVVVLNNLSITDYELITLCQNHSSLKLVSNDKKLLKSGRILLGNRILGSLDFIDYLYSKDPNNVTISKVRDLISSNYERMKV